MRWDNYPQSSPSQVEDTARKPQLKVLEKTGSRVATVSGLEEQRGPSLQGQFKSIDVYALRCFHYPSAAGVLSGKEVPQTTSSISNTLCAMSLETELLGGHRNLFPITWRRGSGNRSQGLSMEILSFPFSSH